MNTKMKCPVEIIKKILAVSVFALSFATNAHALSFEAPSLPSQESCFNGGHMVTLFGEHRFAVKSLQLDQKTYDQLQGVFGQGPVYYLYGEEEVFALFNSANQQLCLSSLSEFEHIQKTIVPVQKSGASVEADSVLDWSD